MDDPRDLLLAEMLPDAAALAIAVHDRDPAAVADVITPLLDQGDRARVSALLVCLAAMVPADMRLGDLLGWTFHPGEQLPYEDHAGEGEKRCRKCDRFLPLAAFHRDRSRTDGRTYVCRECACKGPVVLPVSYRQARQGGAPVGIAVQAADVSINAARAYEHGKAVA